MLYMRCVSCGNERRVAVSEWAPGGSVLRMAVCVSWTSASRIGTSNPPVKGCGCGEAKKRVKREFAGRVVSATRKQEPAASLMKVVERSDKDRTKVEVDPGNALKREAEWIPARSSVQKQGAPGHYTHSS